VVRDYGFGWVVPEAAVLDPYPGEQLKMAARIFFRSITILLLEV
jgi:hypothetical protein